MILSFTSLTLLPFISLISNSIILPSLPKEDILFPSSLYISNELSSSFISKVYWLYGLLLKLCNNKYNYIDKLSKDDVIAKMKEDI